MNEIKDLSIGDNMNIFKKKKKLEIGQIWANKPTSPFGEIWYTEILDLKEGWVEAKSWVRDYEDTMHCSSPRDYKEKDFRFFHPVYING